MTWLLVHGCLAESPEKGGRVVDHLNNDVPQAPDSERALIGALLLDPSQIVKVCERIKPSHIYRPSHRLPFEALVSLDERGIRVDPIQLIEELRQRGTLDKVGGAAFVAEQFIGGLPAQIDDHIDRVIEAAIRRKFWMLGQGISEGANSGQAVKQIESQIRKGLAELELFRAPKEEQAEMALASSWASFDAEEFRQGERVAFAVERGEIALLNALPNAGKTTLALNVAISRTVGRTFPPVVMDAKSCRVLYVDGETRRARLQRDVRQMTVGFSRDEAIAVGHNNSYGDNPNLTSLNYGIHSVASGGHYDGLSNFRSLHNCSFFSQHH